MIKKLWRKIFGPKNVERLWELWELIDGKWEKTLYSTVYCTKAEFEHLANMVERHGTKQKIRPSKR